MCNKNTRKNVSIRTKTALNFLGLEPGVSQSQIQERFEYLYLECCEPSLPESAPMSILFSGISLTLSTYSGGEVRGFKAVKDTLKTMRVACAWLVENNKVFSISGSWLHVKDSQLTVSDWEKARELGFKPGTINRPTWTFRVEGDESKGRGRFSSSDINSKYGYHVVDYSTEQLEKKLKNKQQKDEEDNELKKISQSDKKNSQDLDIV